MLWYSAFSLPWPMYSFVATLNCVTALPLARLRISGSRVRRPVKRTRFTVRFSFSAGRRSIGRPCVPAGTWGGQEERSSRTCTGGYQDLRGGFAGDLPPAL